MDHFGLVEPDDRLGERVVVTRPSTEVHAQPAGHSASAKKADASRRISLGGDRLDRGEDGMHCILSRNVVSESSGAVRPRSQALIDVLYAQGMLDLYQERHACKGAQ